MNDGSMIRSVDGQPVRGKLKAQQLRIQKEFTNDDEG